MGGGCCIPLTLLHYNMMVNLIRFWLSEGQYFPPKTSHTYIFILLKLQKKEIYRF